MNVIKRSYITIMIFLTRFYKKEKKERY